MPTGVTSSSGNRSPDVWLTTISGSQSLSSQGNRSRPTGASRGTSCTGDGALVVDGYGDVPRRARRSVVATTALSELIREALARQLGLPELSELLTEPRARLISDDAGQGPPAPRQLGAVRADLDL